MPIYVYRCADAHDNERLVPRAAGTLAIEPVWCEECSGSTFKSIQASGWKLKGVGFPSQAMRRSREMFPEAFGQKASMKDHRREF